MAHRAHRRLQPKHLRVLHLALQGASNVEIAAAVGLRRETVSRILNSPPGQAELARLRDEARARLDAQLERIGQEAVAINQSLMRDAQVPPRVRATIARHFMDRVVFERAEEPEGSYRDLLRKLDEWERRPQVAVQVNVGAGGPAEEAPPPPEPPAGDPDGRSGTRASLRRRSTPT
jgi:hypothetical protein